MILRVGELACALLLISLAGIAMENVSIVWNGSGGGSDKFNVKADGGKIGETRVMRRGD
jgi:hypothetical protein